MGRRSERTPRSQVRSALRKLWLRSRERAWALKSAGYSCEECGVKQSKAKGREVYVEVHHLDADMSWEHIIDYIIKHLLCHPDNLEVVCKDCHNKIHHKDAQ